MDTGYYANSIYYGEHMAKQSDNWPVKLTFMQSMHKKQRKLHQNAALRETNPRNNAVTCLLCV